MANSSLDLKFLDSLLKHLVGYAVHFKLIDECSSRLVVYSMFPVEVCGKWFLMTSGHILKKYREVAESGEIEILRRSLIDHTHSQATHKDGIPFNLLERKYYAIDNETDGDYALVSLNCLEIEGMKKNGIEPLRFSDKANSNKNFSSYGLVGFPCDNTRNSSDGSGWVAPIYVPLKIENGFDFNEAGLIPASIINHGDLDSLNGLSGGPVFGFMQLDGQAIGYLIGVQSRATGTDKLRFTPTRIINDLLEKILG